MLRIYAARGRLEGSLLIGSLDWERSLRNARMHLNFYPKLYILKPFSGNQLIELQVLPEKTSILTGTSPACVTCFQFAGLLNAPFGLPRLVVWGKKWP